MDKTVVSIDTEVIEETSVPRVWYTGGERRLDPNFFPYGYLKLGGKPVELVLQDVVANGGVVLQTETVKLRDGAQEAEFLKVTVKLTDHVVLLRDAAEKHEVESRECDILYKFRYAIDKDLYPIRGSNLQCVQCGAHTSSTHCTACGAMAIPPSLEAAGLRTVAIDIETYNPRGMSQREKDPIIVISLAWRGLGAVRKLVLDTSTMTEKEVLDQVMEKLRVLDPDVLVTYNGDKFDWPYIEERARQSNIWTSIGRDGSTLFVRGGETRITGRACIDLWRLVIRELTDVKETSLKDVCDTLNIVKRGDRVIIEGSKIASYWDNDRETLLKYAGDDAISTLLLAEHLLPTQFAVCNVAATALQDTCHLTRGRQVEVFKMREARLAGYVVPSKRTASGTVAEMEGGYVLQPPKGLRRDIDVVDIASTYPSIILQHNISPETLCTDAACTKRHHTAPEVGHRFHYFEDQPGFISGVVQKLLALRGPWKKRLKSLTPGTPEYIIADAVQYAYKVQANALYGVMMWTAYRWFRPECAESITAWGRHYVKLIIERAREMNLNPFYSDTDSCFLDHDPRVKDLVEAINAELPVTIESEGLYPAGLFTGKKKRYALLRKDGKVKVRGLESRRGDWCRLARKTQDTVIELVLKGEDLSKALDTATQHVRQTVRDLRAGKVNRELLILKRGISKEFDDYEAKQPHVEAVKRALVEELAAGSNGSLVSEEEVRDLLDQRSREMVDSEVWYVVMHGSGNLNEKTKLVATMNEPDWTRLDLDYYVDKQVMTAGLRILEVFGVVERDILGGPKPTTLKGWTA